MCKFCDSTDYNCCIFKGHTDSEWYIDHAIKNWQIADQFGAHDRTYIKYCPWCGLELATKFAAV